MEKGGAGGEAKLRCGNVAKEGLASTVLRDRLHVEATLGSATSWDRPVDRSLLVRVRRDGLSVIVGWGLSRRSTESLAERVAELLELESPARERLGA